MIGYNNKELPCEKCGGKCCFYAPIELKVWNKLKHKIDGEIVKLHLWKGTPKEAFVVMKPNSNGECYFLKNGKCSVYTYRPKSCRACGVLFPCGEVDPAAAMALYQKTIDSGHQFTYDKYKGAI